MKTFLMTALLVSLPAAALADVAAAPSAPSFVFDKEAPLKVPALAKSMGWSGQTVVTVTLDEHTKIQSVAITSHSGHAALDEACEAYAKNSTYKLSSPQAVPTSGTAVIACRFGSQAGPNAGQSSRTDQLNANMTSSNDAAKFQGGGGSP